MAKVVEAISKILTGLVTAIDAPFALARSVEGAVVRVTAGVSEAFFVVLRVLAFAFGAFSRVLEIIITPLKVVNIVSILMACLKSMFLTLFASVKSWASGTPPPKTRIENSKDISS